MKYFISYSHEDGFGMVEILRKNEIKTFDDLLAIAKAIEFSEEVRQVVLINYQKLTNEPPR